MQAYQPKTFPDIVNAIPGSISEQFEKYKDDLEKAHWHIASAHEKMENQYNRHRSKSVKYEVGDWVLLSHESIKWAPESELKSTKLLTPWLGPFLPITAT